MSNTADATPVAFDPCGVPGSEQGCATCPMASQCIPKTADEEDFFVDPAEPPRPLDAVEGESL